MITTKTKEHPILFKGEMVRAILNGSKTQTRRIVKPFKFHPDFGQPKWDEAFTEGSYLPCPCLKVPYGGSLMGETTQRYFSKWEVGERLWVRETFAVWDGGQFAREGN